MQMYPVELFVLDSTMLNALLFAVLFSFLHFYSFNCLLSYVLCVSYFLVSAAFVKLPKTKTETKKKKKNFF